MGLRRTGPFSDGSHSDDILFPREPQDTAEIATTLLAIFFLFTIHSCVRLVLCFRHNGLNDRDSDGVTIHYVPPIHALPVEIAIRIIEEAVLSSQETPDAESLRKRLLCAVRISHVDSRWRRIAVHKCPGIWTHVLIDHRAQSMEITKQCYARSKMLPLHVRIETAEMFSCIPREDIVDPLEEPSVASRLKTLRVRGNDDGHNRDWFEPIAFTDSLEELEFIYMDCFDDVPCYVTFQGATSLQRLTLDNVGLPLPSITSLARLKYLSWSNFWSLDDEAFIPTLGKLLASARDLETLKLGEIFHLAVLGDGPNKIIPLLNLRNLLVEGISDEAFAFLATLMVAPQLDVLSITFPWSPNGSIHIQWLHWPLARPFPFLRTMELKQHRRQAEPREHRSQARFAMWMLRSAPVVECLHIESYAFLSMWTRQRNQGRADLPKLDRLADLKVMGCPPSSKIQAARNLNAIHAFVVCRKQYGYRPLTSLTLHGDDIGLTPDSTPAFFENVLEEVGNLRVR